EQVRIVVIQPVVLRHLEIVGCRTETRSAVTITDDERQPMETPEATECRLSIARPGVFPELPPARDGAKRSIVRAVIVRDCFRRLNAFFAHDLFDRGNRLGRWPEVRGAVPLGDHQRRPAPLILTVPDID